MSDQSAKGFLQLLERSQIVQGDRLDEALSSLSGKAGGRPVELQELTSHLLDLEVVTDWHVDKLLAGKYKGFFLGNYKLLGYLGSGGMSSVYLAEHKITYQKRAIKVLPRKRVADKSYLDRFYQEARAAASVDDPNVVRVYDIDHDGKTHFMVMEYLEGSDLSEIVKADGPLAIDRAVEYLLQAARGLHHIHQRNLVHRDIKPANLLLTPDGVVKILDLGLALIEQDDEASLTLMYNEKVMGTADYLSPEQALNSHDVDSRADIYSLGCTLYFLLTGKPPFSKGNLAQRLAMHQTQTPTDVRQLRSDCPDGLAAICQQMMMKRAEERYPDCQALQSELNGFLETGQQLGIGLMGTPVSIQQQQQTATSSPTNTVPTTESGVWQVDTHKRSGVSGTLKTIPASDTPPPPSEKLLRYQATMRKHESRSKITLCLMIGGVLLGLLMMLWFVLSHNL